MKSNIHIVNYLLPIIFLVLIGCTNFQKICLDEGSDQLIGEKDGYRYELWNQNAQGNACITIGNDALFSGTWNGIENYLARRGLDYNQTKTHNELGTFSASYDCDYNPSSSYGKSYLSVYGWTVDPLIEYYIIEDWKNSNASMSPKAVFKGTLKIDGSVYDIYTKTRVDKPSIVGITTFQQFFSIRRDRRNCGLINISEHFKKWDSLGMTLGKLDEVSFVVEGYQSNGSFSFKKLDITISEKK